MKSLLVWIGALLMVIGFVALFFFIVIPAVLPSFDDSPLIKNSFQALFCNSGEVLVDSHATYNPDPTTTVTTVTLGCVESAGQARDVGSKPILFGTVVRDVGSKPILFGMVGFLVPFLGGLAILMVGTNMKQRSASGEFMAGSMVNQADRQNQLRSALKSSGLEVNTGADGEVTVNMPDGRVVSGHRAQLGTSAAPAERLKALKTAFDSGLITQEEFDRKHQEILNEM